MGHGHGHGNNNHNNNNNNHQSSKKKRYVKENQSNNMNFYEDKGDHSDMQFNHLDGFNKGGNNRNNNNINNQFGNDGQKE